MAGTLQKNISLKPYNTFGVEVVADEFVVISGLDGLKDLIINGDLLKPHLFLGGGSNVLFGGDFHGLVIKNELKGIHISKEDESHVWITAASGEIWHDLVMYAVSKGWGGIENLSLIPGTVGAAPMQNIGAYGVELTNVFYSLEALDLLSGDIKQFTHEDCAFGYRESVFKHEAKGKYFIASVTLRLSKNPQVHISYGAIKDVLDSKHISNPGIKDVSDAVISIRQSKLPDPKVLGNAGSFFKNPEIDIAIYESLKVKYPDMPGYPVSNQKIKVPAGWLIEQCGWKGKIVGHTGAHKNQALVLVNYGGATGKEIMDLAYSIRQSVLDTFGILINPEVNLI